MTGHSHETIGSLIARHKATNEAIRVLTGPYNDLARQLRDLSSMANDHKSTITVTPEGFTSGCAKIIPLNILDSFSETLTKLQSLREEQRNIETCLKDIGMDDYIPKEQHPA